MQAFHGSARTHILRFILILNVYRKMSDRFHPSLTHSHHAREIKTVTNFSRSTWRGEFSPLLLALFLFFVPPGAAFGLL